MSGSELTMRLGLDKILDPYDLTARLLPGLLVLLPAILCIAVLYGAKSPLAVALGSVLATCGGPYLLSSFVRTWGQRAQDRLFRQWGGQPTTLLLRHRHDHLPPLTKGRYRELAASRLSVALPTDVEEEDDPTKADQAYVAQPMPCAHSRMIERRFLLSSRSLWLTASIAMPMVHAGWDWPLLRRR